MILFFYHKTKGLSGYFQIGFKSAWYLNFIRTSTHCRLPTFFSFFLQERKWKDREVWKDWGRGGDPRRQEAGDVKGDVGTRHPAPRDDCVTRTGGLRDGGETGIWKSTRGNPYTAFVNSLKVFLHTPWVLLEITNLKICHFVSLVRSSVPPINPPSLSLRT